MSEAVKAFDLGCGGGGPDKKGKEFSTGKKKRTKKKGQRDRFVHEGA